MQCVVLAAGEGKRMRPLTARRPKVMLPIANRPMMEHLILAARDAGVTDFIIVVGYFEREIRNHVGDGRNFGVNITYVTQRHQLGTGDALRRRQEWSTTGSSSSTGIWSSGAMTSAPLPDGCALYGGP